MNPDKKRGYIPSLRTRVFSGIAALTLAALACRAPKPPDPCDEAFQALTTAFTGTRPGVIGDGVINVWKAIPGKNTHPRIQNWQGRNDVNWRDVASYIKFNCKDQYTVESLAIDQGERFYDDGVIVRKKSTQNFSLPETNVNGMGAFFSTFAALLGLGTLGIGVVKKLVIA